MLTRKQYLDGEATFEGYYGEILEECGIAGSAVDLERVKAALASGDEHLNSIPLRVWDAWGTSLLAYQGSRLRQAFQRRGDIVSAAGLVCLTKLSAKRAANKGD